MTDGHMDRRTDGQTDRQTDRQMRPKTIVAVQPLQAEAPNESNHKSLQHHRFSGEKKENESI